MRKTTDEKGLTLVELVLVVAAVGFLILLIANLPSSLSLIGRSRHTSLARDIAGKQVEYLRRQTYANLPLGSTPFTNTELGNLPGSSGVYEVEDCPSNLCLNEEDAKKVVVRVTWAESNETKKVELVTLIGEGGLAQ